ncbi:hypothetical protein GLOTRDRAFT_113424 [Gloeophyllum trabeum ATCC 11539]|uniref:Uncharacterized protein n=1 Tax=Gloeophyllum trabeum (strain ATCC 11539 / FP-39264 / Madison 617) TaxID=670483 RepID=S7S0M9_GLOTA|nr:uncharacterized protein GLOTRDRAFT_113424 [Gloeophyllum trabeum ATCC 11539]EPQ60920.1 hypothetical protein GLOTRDRAFT_113424 [Gloeophyllum trabeum ATCC 11539]
MLKRARPITPPPPPEEPLIPSSSDYSQRDMKRRRTAAPSLDGPSRGWAPLDADSGDEDDEVDEWQLDDNDGRTAEYSRETSERYRASNTLLHDLHAEYQHRLLFMPSPSQHSRSDMQSYPPHPSITSCPAKQDVLRLSDRPIMVERNGHLHRHTNLDIQGEKEGIDTAEGLRVKERYEESNRLLRSLVLSRRRESTEGT